MLFAPDSKKCLALLTAAGALFLTGCVEFDAHVTVQPDGSGALTITSGLHQNRGNRLLLTALAGLGGDPDAIKDPVGDLYSRKSFLVMAHQLGEGVHLVSSERTTREDGVEGATATYRFSDVNQLKLGPQLIAAPLRRLGFEPMDWSYRFKMQDAADGSKELYILPPQRTDEKGLSLRESLNGADRMPGFDRMLADAVRPARIHLDVTVAGTITHSNSQFLNKARNGAALLHLPVANILDHSGVDALKDFKRLEDIEALRKAHIPGVKIESPKSPIGIRFN